MNRTSDLLAAYQKYVNTERHDLSVKCIFFDMDGVLLNSMPNHAIAWVKSFNEFGLDLPVGEAYMNEGSPAFMTVKNMFLKYKNRILTDAEAEVVKKRKHSIMGELTKSPIMVAMPGFMKQLFDAGIDRWVVTGSAQNIIIDRLELEYDGLLQRDKMITAFDVKIGKPEPEPYLKAMEKSGYTTSNAIVVENAPLGVLSAKAAGLFTIAINTGPIDPQVLVDAGADLVFSGSEELNERWLYIQKIFCT